MFSFFVCISICVLLSCSCVVKHLSGKAALATLLPSYSFTNSLPQPGLAQHVFSRTVALEVWRMVDIEEGSCPWALISYKVLPFSLPLLIVKRHEQHLLFLL